MEKARYQAVFSGTEIPGREAEAGRSKLASNSTEEGSKWGMGVLVVKG